MQLVVNSNASLNRAVSEIQSVWESHKYFRLSVRTGKDRSLDQNSLIYAWYAEIAKALPEDDALGWKCYCKLHHGVPILRTEDDEFRAAYDAAIKGLTYEQKLMAMRVLPVTSRMNVKQLTKYADAVQNDFAARGVVLVVKGSE